MKPPLNSDLDFKEISLPGGTNSFVTRGNTGFPTKAVPRAKSPTIGALSERSPISMVSSPLCNVPLIAGST